MTPDYGWQNRAACRDAPWEMFFPSSQSTSENRRLELEAVAMCKACPVREECGEYAQTSNMGGREQAGIWAGKNMGPKHKEIVDATWNRPRTLECEICLTRWRWTPISGYRQPPKTCSARCLAALRSRIARARETHGFERSEAG